MFIIYFNQGPNSVLHVYTFNMFLIYTEIPKNATFMRWMEEGALSGLENQ